MSRGSFGLFGKLLQEGDSNDFRTAFVEALEIVGLNE